MPERTSSLSRHTNETQIEVALDLDGQGTYELDTPNGMLNHLLAQLARHGLFDLRITAAGDVDVGWHHLVEDLFILIVR